MINEALVYITKDINDYFKSRFDLSESKVVLSNLVNENGSIAVSEENKIVHSLINIEQDTSTRSISKTSIVNNGQVTYASAPINLNLNVMFSAYYTDNNYSEALKMIDNVISFFQHKNLFTPRNSPGLPSGLNKLTFEIVTLSLQELTGMWSMLGAKYMPSIIYKMRMISIQQGGVSDHLPASTSNKPSMSSN